MENLPMLNALSHPKKNELIMELWEENQRLEAEIHALKGETSCDETPKKTSKNSSNPPSKDQKSNKKPAEKKTRKPRTEGNNGRCLDPNPSQTVVARAKTCPHCGEMVNPQRLHATYDKIEIPPVQPIVTRVEQYGGHCPHCHENYVSPVPAGLEPGTPFGSCCASNSNVSTLCPFNKL